MAMPPTCSRRVFAGREGATAAYPNASQHGATPARQQGLRGGAREHPPTHLPQPAKPHTTWPRTCEEGLHELTVGHFHDGPPRVGRKRWISTIRQ